MDAFFNSPLLLLPCVRLCGGSRHGLLPADGGDYVSETKRMTLVGASPVEGLVRDYLECSIGVVRIGEGGNPIRSSFESFVGVR